MAHWGLLHQIKKKTPKQKYRNFADCIKFTVVVRLVIYAKISIHFEKKNVVTAFM